MEAVGVYFNRLAERRGLKVGAVAEQAGKKAGYISRLISQDIHDPAASTLKAVNDAVGGSWQDVGALLDPRATAEQAEALADAWYEQLMRTRGIDQDMLRRRLIEAADALLKEQDHR